jgi:hypothetical protein
LRRVFDPLAFLETVQTERISYTFMDAPMIRPYLTIFTSTNSICPPCVW